MAKRVTERSLDMAKTFGLKKQHPQVLLTHFEDILTSSQRIYCLSSYKLHSNLTLR
jgi:hypothetical protein